MRDGKFTWADTDQAVDRLVNTYVMYGDRPVYILEVRSKTITFCDAGFGSDKSQKKVMIDDPEWKDFRVLPPLGWFNTYTTDVPRAIYMKRVPLRNRRHGLINDGVVCRGLYNQELLRDFSGVFQTCIADEGYLATITGEYPSIEEILEKLPKGCSAAASRKFAVSRDDAAGLFWLWRGDVEVGFLSKGNGFTPLDSFGHVVDELKETKGFESIRVEAKTSRE